MLPALALSNTSPPSQKVVEPFAVMVGIIVDSHRMHLTKKDWADLLLKLSRKLGKEMNLFHFREESPGSVFWHEKGWKLFQKLVSYMRSKQEAAGYKEVNTPEILDRALWEKSGHWEKYGEHMYTSQTPDEKIFAIKLNLN